MVLRRTLPSRLTGAAPGAPKAAPVVAPTATPAPSSAEIAAAPTSTVDSNAAALAAATALVMAAPPPAAKPEPVIAVTPAPKPEAIEPSIQEPVASATPEGPKPAAPVTAPKLEEEFGRPAAVAQRVLEDSFTAPSTPAAVATPALEKASAHVEAPSAAISQPEPTPAPAPRMIEPIVEVKPAPSVAVAPAPAPAETPAPMASEPAPVPAAGPTDFLNDNPFVASTPAVASRPQENSLRRRVQKPERPRTPPPPPRADPTASAPQPIAANPAIPAMPEAVPAAPLAAASKPPRNVLPRDFAAATVTAAQAAPAIAAPPPQLDMAPEIPVDTRPLDRVDEELIASGIIAGPSGDTLTSQVPTSLAVAETPFPMGGFGTEPTAFNMPAAPIAPTGFTLATAPHTPAAPGPLPAGFGPSASGSWEVDTGNPTPPPDIFKPQAAVSSFPAGFETAAPNRVPPPTLPEGRPSRAQLAAAGRPGTSWAGMAVAAAALGGVGLFVWQQATQPGGLENVNAQLAKLTQPQTTTVATAPQPENGLLPPPTQMTGGTGNAQIEFAAPLADPNQPIAATGTEAMPEDISVFAKLQQEIQAARAEREGAAAPMTETATTAAPAAPLTKEQSDKELERYRQLLAEADPATAPKPREFLRDPDAFMDGQNNQAQANGGALLPPPASRAENAGSPSTGTLPPPNELYTNNPNGLPIVAEPQMQEAPRIRQLQDFAAELFPQDTQKVKIPQGVRPQLAATDFPSLEVLSFVPGRGLIASADGKEGVLMVGESISGWELTNVSADMAEFRAGNRSYVLTAQN